MKRNIVFAVICAALLFPVVARAEMTKQEAAEFLQKVLKAKVKEAGQEAMEDQLTKLSPKGMAMYKKLSGVISTAELAASICWDLLNLGLQNKRAQFAKEFAIRLRKYIPSEFFETGELFSGMTEKVFGWRITNEADCTTILYELGKNTFDAVTKMSASEKAKVKEAGVSINQLGAFMMGLGGLPAKQYQNLFKK